MRRYFSLVILVAIWAWAAHGTNVGVASIMRGLPYMLEYLGEMFPPDFSILGELVGPLVETLQIAIMGTTFSAMVALPVSFLAAKNVMSVGIVYRLTREALNVLRGIPSLLYALLFVSTVGLGPLPGVLALTCFCIGALGRYFSEAIENIDPKVINAVKATGANKVKIIIHGIIPELGALFVGYILYYFESNVRQSMVLGLVGAGGLGMQLTLSIRLFKQKEAAAILLVIVVLVAILDRLSTVIRARIIGGGIRI